MSLKSHPRQITLRQESSTSGPQTSTSCQISSSIRLEIKCTVNGMHFNHPETIPAHFLSPWKSCPPCRGTDQRQWLAFPWPSTQPSGSAALDLDFLPVKLQDKDSTPFIPLLLIQLSDLLQWNYLSSTCLLQWDGWRECYLYCEFLKDYKVKTLYVY